MLPIFQSNVSMLRFLRPRFKAWGNAILLPGVSADGDGGPGFVQHIETQQTGFSLKGRKIYRLDKGRRPLFMNELLAEFLARQSEC